MKDTRRRSSQQPQSRLTSSDFCRTKRDLRQFKYLKRTQFPARYSTLTACLNPYTLRCVSLDTESERPTGTASVGLSGVEGRLKRTQSGAAPSTSSSATQTRPRSGTTPARINLLCPLTRPGSHSLPPDTRAQNHLTSDTKPKPSSRQGPQCRCR